MTAFVSHSPAFPSTRSQPSPTPKLICKVENSVNASTLAKRSIIILTTAATVLIARNVPVNASLFHFAAPRPTESLGLGGGDRYLQICPPTPNCITTSGDVFDSHFVPPWEYDPVKLPEAILQLKSVLNEYKEEQVKIIEDRKTSSSVGQGWYIATEFETPTFGFVDDVEFFFQPDSKTVEYRSASRIGRDDLKANRKRIKALRLMLQNKYGWRSQGYN